MNDSLLNKRVLGRYRIVDTLAIGGMGVIYLGRSEGAAGFSKPVVIKRIVSDVASIDADAERLFVREAALLSQIRHPGIVGVVDFGDEDRVYTMVLEYVHGYNLAQWHQFFRRSEELFPARLAVYVARLVLSALDYAHNLPQPDGSTLKVVHRDVTPSNVLVDVTGIVKLADFGIARISKGEEEKTQSGLLRGKFSYLAPELLNGAAASVASDVYSAGVLLHELLIGKNEWRCETPAETLRRVLHHTPSSVEQLRPDAPHGIDEVVAKALAKEPRDRFASAREFADALRGLEGPSDTDLARELADRAKVDFEERLPKTLGIVPLSTRDEAWRNAPRSEPPGASSELGRGLATGVFDDPTMRGPSADIPFGAPPPALASDGATVAAVSPVRRKFGTMVAVAVAAVVTGGSVAAFFLARQPPPAPRGARFIVVEQQVDGTGTEPSSDTIPAPVGSDGVAAPSERDASAPASSASAPSAGHPQPSAARPAGDDGPVERLTRTFASRRGAVRGCFERNTLALEGQPSIEIRFRIDASGHVTSASLSPAGLEGTDLGRCLLGVARGTEFGPQAGALSFGIPVTASVARR